MHGSIKVENSKPNFCVAFLHHASFGSSLTSRSQVADIGNHCPVGCVLVTHSAVARRGMFNVDRIIQRCVWCALLKQRIFARGCWRIVFFSFLYFFRMRFLKVFYTFSKLSRFHRFIGCRGQRYDKSTFTVRSILRKIDWPPTKKQLFRVRRCRGAERHIRMRQSKGPSLGIVQWRSKKSSQSKRPDSLVFTSIVDSTL